jgi:alanyl-tRNA synthetase
MIPRTGTQIREDFLRFFESKEHRRVHSSSLVPQNDPTLLFTNAGMNQFKDVFLGSDKRPYTRAATSQKCVRAGGKHNDLENVGFTRRHHTFFEMLGNFSFGDYFKRDAIAYAWELLTSPEWFAIDKSRLYVTIFEGNADVPRDTEAENFWIETGVPKERIFEMSAKDNFWQMGETGPCGPCSEIFYDLGLEASETGNDLPFPQDDQRYVEIWNLVFMQFDRSIGPNGPVLTPLPKPSIDTGMGLERVACVLQGVMSNYQTDLFTPLILRAAELCLTGDGAEYNPNWAINKTPSAASLRIIADHARAATFLISDGVQPSNEGRGYVLRKILRRGIRHGRLLGQEQPFMHQMVLAVRDEMKTAYPELVEASERIAKVVLAEEQQFARVISSALTRLEEQLEKLVSRKHLFDWFLDYEKKFESASKSGVTNESNEALVVMNSVYQNIQATYPLEFKGEYWGDECGTNHILHEPVVYSGKDAFNLYETYGLPLDFMVDAARDAGINFDMEGFEAAKEEEQQRARASWKGGVQKSANPVFQTLAKTEFEGYSALRVDGARVLALVKDGQGVQTLNPGDQGEVVLDATSFYADSGGQIGDTGVLYASDHHTVVAEVRGATKPVQGVFAHKVTAKQTIALGDTVDTAVNGEIRTATERNHTGTHLLHAALREVLGKHVKQAGSLVNQNRLRFDFSHFTGVSEQELEEIETIVNQQVLANAVVETLVDVPIDVAVKELGAMALFGEKYGDRVRVVKIGDFSAELCGGTHTRATGEIGLIKLVGESSVSSGVRRLEAISGTSSLHEFRRDYDITRAATQALGLGNNPDAESLRARLSAADEELKKLRRELDQARMKAANANSADAAPVEVKGIKVLAQRVSGLDKNQMRTLVDSLRTKLGSGVVVLGAEVEGKVALIVGVTKDLTGKIPAGKVVGQLAALVDGKGGGRPDLAEAGGANVGALDGALAKATEVVGSFL